MVDEELSLDYNRKLYCKNCHEEEDFYLKKSSGQQCCDQCGKFVVHGKKCCNCEEYLLCLECYDLEQM
jgi:hypothetical protein